MTHKQQIMIVDDVEINCELLSIIFADIFDTVTAYSGENAIELMRANKPNLVLLDVMMPGMDGFEVCKYIKENEDLSSIKVIMISGNSATEEEGRCISCGSDAYVKKPYETAALRIQVMKMLGVSL